MADSELILPDGRRVAIPADTSVLESLGRPPEAAVALRQDGRVLDFMTPVPAGAGLALVPGDSPEGLHVVRHSAAHLMAAAVQALFPEARFAIGPAIADGFYYDMELPRALTPEDLPVIEAKMRELASRRLPYERREMPIAEAIAWAKEHGQTYKVEILEALQATGSARPEAEAEELTGEAAPGAERVTFYRTGEFLDL
ncbi:MAG: threonine--tRNA ligase, partial [Candidatus Methylomirabilales bacterium]